MRTIVVGIHGSEHAAQALQWAVEEAGVHDAEVLGSVGERISQPPAAAPLVLPSGRALNLREVRT